MLYYIFNFSKQYFGWQQHNYRMLLPLVDDLDACFPVTVNNCIQTSLRLVLQLSCL